MKKKENIKNEVNFERCIQSSTLHVTTNIHTQHLSQHAYNEHMVFVSFVFLFTFTLANILEFLQAFTNIFKNKLNCSQNNAYRHWTVEVNIQGR
jgi:hypothetical protein